MESENMEKSKTTCDTKNKTNGSLDIEPEKIMQEGKTTLMIKNIPNKYTKNMLLNEI
jgi:hypothetical protein